MNNSTLSAVLSAVFIVAGSWFIARFTSSGDMVTGKAKKFSILDGELIINDIDAVTFGVSGVDAKITKKTTAAFQKIADHLKNNKTRLLTLCGNYYSSEKTNEDIDLGMARAQVLKDKMVEMGACEKT